MFLNGLSSYLLTHIPSAACTFHTFTGTTFISNNKIYSFSSQKRILIQYKGEKFNPPIMSLKSFKNPLGIGLQKPCGDQNASSSCTLPFSPYAPFVLIQYKGEKFKVPSQIKVFKNPLGIGLQKCFVTLYSLSPSFAPFVFCRSCQCYRLLSGLAKSTQTYKAFEHRPQT